MPERKYVYEAIDLAYALEQRQVNVTLMYGEYITLCVIWDYKDDDDDAL